jgi:hypothetical protein
VDVVGDELDVVLDYVSVAEMEVLWRFLAEFVVVENEYTFLFGVVRFDELLLETWQNDLVALS